MECITLCCNAKINLALDVIGRRADGYHDVKLIFKEIALCDKVTVSLNSSGIIKLSCDDEALPSDAGNIAYRAADIILGEIGRGQGAEIVLCKRIPHGAGLAGGSADAAGVLKAVNLLCGEPVSEGRLMELGARLGADVPFCILGGCAYGEGIGDILTPLPNFGEYWYVIVMPGESISTRWVYENLDLKKRPPGLDVNSAVERFKDEKIEEALCFCGNIMESVTAEKVPVIYEIKNKLKDAGAEFSMMSGSGTAVFGMFKEKTAAKAAADAVKDLADRIFLV